MNTELLDERVLTLESWPKPPRLDHPVAFGGTWSPQDFVDYYWNVDTDYWWMTEAQRETWLNEIFSWWDKYRHVVAWDATDRHLKQLQDMHYMGGALVLIAQEYGTGKSVIANTHLKLWQIMTINRHGRFMYPYIYWRRKNARTHVKAAPLGSAHSVDEDQEDSGSGSKAVVKHLLNMFKTIRKTDKLCIQAGINVKPGELGRAVAMEIRPFGFNERTQANRFIVYNYRGEPLWLAAIQRIYSPDDYVYYTDELGTFGEYDARANTVSDTDGIHSARDTQHDKDLAEQLAELWDEEFPGIRPNMSSLRLEARELFNAELVDQMDEVVAYAAKLIEREQKGEGRPDMPNRRERRIELTADGWLGLRKGLQQLSRQYNASARDAEALSLYYVPERPLISYGEICDALGLSIKPDSLGTAIRRRRTDIPTKPIGDLIEHVSASWLDSLRPEVHGGSGQPDLILHPADTEPIAVNVKGSLEDSYREYIPTTPEYQYRPRALVLLVLPRLLELRLYPITAEKQTINRAEGLLSTPEGVSNHVIEMLEVADE